ncbi:uncharacterized protein (DUF1697 family) [Saonia flava]|uniref:Uncharacterized protein (DUF1697 family) n=1 Tax=Saonia flava TaxID=523696 RepID=A0A846R1L9_9FLAO|nr:DUF1697 domain-containing protein [Saonia flava]NJB71835.1 uncharacterized protein (DUF1697 family) [Saonia flava]
MKTYIALLRGINVSGQKKILMVDLKKSMEQLGLKEVVTYIQSGNVVFKSEDELVDILEDKIKETIMSNFGFDVPVLVTTFDILNSILLNNPFSKEEDKKQYFVLLKDEPKASLVEEFHETSYNNEDFVIAGQCIYLVCHKGAGNAKLNNNLIERKLKVSATTRNLRTMTKLVELASG